MASEKALQRVKDLDEQCGVPMTLYWETEEIAEWMEEIGYPEYKECITKNLITGRQLICLDSSKLPQIGITNFEHIKDISAKVRKLINLDHVIKNIKVSMGNPMIAYMEHKRRTGRHSSSMSYISFLAANKRWYL